MLARWWDLMPVFVVRWVARRYCMRVPVGDSIYVYGTKGVLFLDTAPDNGEE